MKLKAMAEFFSSLYDGILKLILSVQWYDIVDIVFVAFLLYYCIRLLRQTRAFNLIKGIVFVSVIYLIVSALDMSASTFIFNNLFRDIVLVIILLFQPEIRNTIESFGRGNFKIMSFFSTRSSDKYRDEAVKSASSIAKAVVNMSENKVGALVVIEGKTPLGEFVASGSEVNAAITTPLLENIFFPKAPLHDGAVVIKNNRIYAAGCILPLSQNEMSLELGTRHRAALGMSEVSDALIVVVSEESGRISVAQNGVLERDLKLGELTEFIASYLASDDPEKLRVFRRPRRKKQ